MKIIFMIAAGCGAIGFFPSLSQADDFGSITLQHESSFSRLNVSLDDSFKPRVKDTGKGFEVTIPSASLMDIGVPFGGEAEFNRYLNEVKDGRIHQLKVRESEAGLVISGFYRFPVGKDALANPVMEHFDFNQKDQGRFVIDFWYKKGMTVSEAQKKKRLEDLKKMTAEKAEILKKEAEKKALKEKRIEQSKNALRFCESPIDRENTLWVKYRAEHVSLNLNSYFPEFIPDHGFRYREPSGKSEEEQMIRLALKLSRENRHGLSIKTIEFLEKKYPNSKYMDEMMFLKASSFYRLELFNQGREMVIDLSKTRRKTDVGLQSTAFLGVQAFRNQEWLSTIDSFMKILKESPQHPLAWLFHYGIAESLYQIKQYDQARSEYEWLVKNATKEAIRAEAAFKIGDLRFNRNQYAQAIQAYTDAIRKNEALVTGYPHVWMNLGESLFQLEEYEKALVYFQKYLDQGRAFPAAWKAGLRRAEIQSILKPKDFEKNFIETVNQHPLTPGAVIARLRMMPCGNHGGFDLASSLRYLSSPEVKNIEGQSSFYDTSLSELVSLTEVRTLLSFEQDEKAIEKGILLIRSNPSIEARKLVEIALVGGVKRSLERFLSQDQYYAAIAFFEKFGDYLPPPTYDPVSDSIRLKIAKFAADKKLTSLAMKLIETYRGTDESEMRAAANEIHKSLFLESKNDQEERIFIEAKSLWNGEKFDAKDEKTAAQFQEKLELIRVDSRFAVERDLMRALYDRSIGSDLKAFERVRNFSGKLSSFKPRIRAQVLSFVAELAFKNGEFDDSVLNFREARKIVLKLTDRDADVLEYRQLPDVPSVSHLYASEGEALEQQQKWKEAVALYSEAIENKIGGNRVLYAHARALLRDGSRESKLTASRSLEKIQQSQEDDIWKKLAQKALDGIAKEGKNDEKR